MLFLLVGRREGDAGTDVRKDGRDLLRVPVLGALLRWRHFNTLLLVPTLAFFAIVVGAGLFGEQNTSNPAVLLTWILWWPAVIFTFFLVGRIWCAICPFGYAGDLVQRITTFGWKAPRLLKNMWWRLSLFLLLTWFTTLFALDRSPRGTAWLALTLTIGAVGLAVVYEKRMFCRYVCPLGGIFGLYSMTAPVALSAKDQSVCRSGCRTKDCAARCMWFQFPAYRDRGAECNLCLDCVRACPHDNLALVTQPIGTELSTYHSRRRSLDEAATVAAILGVALLQTAVMINAWDSWQADLAAMLHVQPGPLLYTLIYVAFGVGLPLLVLSALSLLSSRGEWARPDIAAALRTYAYAFVPLGLGLHAAHNFHHLFGESGALWTGLRSWIATVTGRGLTAAASAGADAPINSNLLFFLQWLALAGGLYLALRISAHLARRHAGGQARAVRMALPIQVFALAYTVMNVLLLAAPMAHRH